MPKALIIGLAFVVTVGISTVAEAQSARDLDNRLRRMENELQTLSRSVYRGEVPTRAVSSSGAASAGGSGAQANTEIRLQQLEGSIQSLTGRVEEQSYEMRQLKSQLERMSADLNVRFNDLQGSGASSGSAASAAGRPSLNAPSTQTVYESPATTSGGAGGFNTGSVSVGTRSGGTLGTLPAGSATKNGTAMSASGAYEHAFSLLKTANYTAAEGAFSDFLAKYPDHVLAGNAKYWLGETFYVRGDYTKASRIFAEGYQKYPDGAKAADNLLKLGMSLGNSGNKADACVALGQLKKQYTNGVGPVLRRADQEMSRLGCS